METRLRIPETTLPFSYPRPLTEVARSITLLETLRNYEYRYSTIYLCGIVKDSVEKLWIVTNKFGDFVVGFCTRNPRMQVGSERYNSM